MDAKERTENTADTVKVCLKREKWIETAIPTQERRYLMEEIKYWLAKSTTRQLLELLPEICKGVDSDVQTSPLYDMPRDIYEEHLKCTGKVDDIFVAELVKQIDDKTTPEDLRRLHAEKTTLTGRSYVPVEGYTVDGENIGVVVKDRKLEA